MLESFVTNSLVRREWKFVSTFWALSHVAMDYGRAAGAGGGSSIRYVKREVAVRALDKSSGFFAHSKHLQTGINNSFTKKLSGPIPFTYLDVYRTRKSVACSRKKENQLTVG